MPRCGRPGTIGMVCSVYLANPAYRLSPAFQPKVFECLKHARCSPHAPAQQLLTGLLTWLRRAFAVLVLQAQLKPEFYDQNGYPRLFDTHQLLLFL